MRNKSLFLFVVLFVSSKRDMRKKRQYMKSPIMRAVEVVIGLAIFLAIIWLLCTISPEQRGDILTVAVALLGISTGCLWIWIGFREKLESVGVEV